MMGWGGGVIHSHILYAHIHTGQGVPKMRTKGVLGVHTEWMPPMG
jgi:hypothetical protein